MLQEMSPDVLDKYAALAGVGSHSHNFLTKGATRVHDAVLGCGLRLTSCRCASACFAASFAVSVRFIARTACNTIRHEPASAGIAADECPSMLS